MNLTTTSTPIQLSLFDDDLEPHQRYTTCGGITLRYYQKDAAENCFKLWNEGSPGALVRAATGTGKTILACSVIDRWLSLSEDHHAIILTHERQLAYQFTQEARDVLGIPVGLEMANEFVTTMDMPRVVVASRATLLPRKKKGYDEPVSRLRKFNPDKPWLIVVDEAHKYLRNGLKSCKHVFDHFEQNKDSKRLGISATPRRGDKKSVRGLFPDIAYDYPLYAISSTLSSAIKDGYAVPYDQRFVIVEQVDWKNIKTIGTDFSDGDLGAALQERKTMLSFIQPTLDMVGDKQTLIFSPTVAMAQQVAYAINEELGIKNAAVSINGETPHDMRMTIYEQFENKGFQFLSVCGLCVAEGTLVLTDQGEIPIERVTVDMKLWDGVEYVSHDGVVSSGIKTVYEYAGLRATKNHRLWTADGWMTLAECKLEDAPIVVTGDHGRPILEANSHYRTDRYKQRRLHGGMETQVYDILNAGPRFRFTANGLLISNCREGYNNPGIQAIAVFRPTKSLGLAEQMKGRGCRPLRGIVDGLDTAEERLAAIAASDKPACIIVDLVGASGMCDTATTAHILAEGLEDEVIELANKNALAKDGPVDMAEEIKAAQDELEETKVRKAEHIAAMKARAAELARIKGKVIYTTQRVDPGDNAGEAAVERMPTRMPFGKHKGRMLSDIPSGYLHWLTQQYWTKQHLRRAIKAEVQYRTDMEDERRERKRKRSRPYQAQY